MLLVRDKPPMSIASKGRPEDRPRRHRRPADRRRLADPKSQQHQLGGGLNELTKTARNRRHDRLGNMGNGVTRRLLEREYPVVAFSRTPAKVESLRLYGAIISPSLRDLAGRVAAIAVTAAPLLWPRCYYVASCGIHSCILLDHRCGGTVSGVARSHVKGERSKLGYQ